MLAYAATCHKMQGGECPLVFGIWHQANKRPLNREWAYTQVTRASQRCVVFYTKQGMGFALGKQNIKGATLEAKVKTFVALTQSGLVGPSVRVKIPKPCSLNTEVTAYVPPTREPTPPPPPPEPTVILRERVIVVERVVEREPEKATPPVDGGDLTPQKPKLNILKVGGKPVAAALPAPKPEPKLVSQWGAYHMAVTIGHAQVMANRLLTYQPAPKEEAKPTPTKPLSIGQLLLRNKK